MKYRKRPTDVEAFQWTGELSDEFREWADTFGFLPAALEGDNLLLEFGVRALPGDWLVRETNGKFTRWGTEVFKAEYERADGHEDIAAWGAEHLKLGSDK